MSPAEAYKLWNNPDEVLTREELFHAGFREACHHARHISSEMENRVWRRGYDEGILKARLEGLLWAIITACLTCSVLPSAVPLVARAFNYS
jgi:hypothetical protein